MDQPSHIAGAGPVPDSSDSAKLEAMIVELDLLMPELQLRHPGVFALANAWAERYDAVLAATPPELREDIEARLSRIGIRWGMMPGARVTREFHAMPVPPPIDRDKP